MDIEGEKQPPNYFDTASTILARIKERFFGSEKIKKVIRLACIGATAASLMAGCGPEGNADTAVINRANAQTQQPVLETEYQASIQGQQPSGEPIIEYSPQPAPQSVEAALPPCFVYVTKDGDTLGGIAYAHGYDLNAVPIIMALNDLSSDVIGTNQRLNIPQQIGNVIGCEP